MFGNCWFVLCLVVVLACDSRSDEDPSVEPFVTTIASGSCATDDGASGTEHAKAMGRSVPRGRATTIHGVDFAGYRIDVTRADGRAVSYTDRDGQIAFTSGDRAEVSLALWNRSDGWIPLNFVVCFDDPAQLRAIAPDGASAADRAMVDDVPCVVRFAEWRILEQGTAGARFTAGAFVARGHASEGSFSVRIETELASAIALVEYAVPYRIEPVEL